MRRYLPVLLLCGLLAGTSSCHAQETPKADTRGTKATPVPQGAIPWPNTEATVVPKIDDVYLIVIRQPTQDLFIDNPKGTPRLGQCFSLEISSDTKRRIQHGDQYRKRYTWILPTETLDPDSDNKPQDLVVSYCWNETNNTWSPKGTNGPQPLPARR